MSIKEREWVYRCPDLQTACRAVERLDTWPKEKLVGLGISARGHLEDDEEFFVHATVERASITECRQIEGILAEFGEQTQWASFGAFYRSSPQPHFTTSGLGAQILMAVRAHYPEVDIPG